MTFTPTEYTVVDQTDYLEINLFGHVTRNDGGAASVDFRVFDISLPPADRMAIDNVALLRE